MDTAADAVNPNPILCIELTNGMQSVKEIYYANGEGSIFSNKHTKKSLIWTFIFLMLAGLFYILSFSDKVAWIFLFVMATGTFLASLVLFFFRAKAYFLWKEKVSSLLKALAKIEKQSLNINDQSFELINDDQVEIEKWDGIKKASITPTYIFLTSESGTHYIFPAKSMNSANYEMLKDFIGRKMKTSSTSSSTT